MHLVAKSSVSRLKQIRVQHKSQNSKISLLSIFQPIWIFFFWKCFFLLIKNSDLFILFSFLIIWNWSFFLAFITVNYFQSRKDILQDLEKSWENGKKGNKYSPPSNFLHKFVEMSSFSWKMYIGLDLCLTCKVKKGFINVAGKYQKYV